MYQVDALMEQRLSEQLHNQMKLTRSPSYTQKLPLTRAHREVNAVHTNLSQFFSTVLCAPYLLAYLLTYLLHGAESFLRS